MKQRGTYDKKSNDLNQLAQKLAKGDAQAIEQIYRRCFQKLFHYGIQVLGSQYSQEVEDVIQEFFIWLAQNHQKMATVRNFEVYMFQSVRRNLYAKVQTAQQKKESFERYLRRTTPLQENSADSPEKLFIKVEEQKQRSTLIQTELDKLPPYQREILYLRYFTNKSYKEIASILNISDQVAYNYVSKAIKKLKKQLVTFALLFLPFVFIS